MDVLHIFTGIGLFFGTGYLVFRMLDELDDDD